MLSAEITQSIVPDCISRLKWIGRSLCLPTLLCHIIIVQVIVAFLVDLLSLISGLALGSLDIKDVQSVPRRIFFFNKWLGSVNIVNLHGISDKFERIWRHISETLKFVDWVQRVRRLSCRLKLYDLGL